jgi:hypothetical protein
MGKERQKQQKEHKMRMTPGTYYVWCGGSCDYGHEERCSGGAYIMQKDEVIIDRYVIADDYTTELRMILYVMIHAMEIVPEGSDIVFLTNAAYIQNFDKAPTPRSANPDLIARCIEAKQRHNTVSVKIVQYHKSPLLIETHDLSTEAMKKLRVEYNKTRKDDDK